MPNKGFPELIYAVKILRDKEFNVCLNLRTASYSPDYMWFYNQLVSLIEQLDLKEYVSIDNHYHDDHDNYANDDNVNNDNNNNSPHQRCRACWILGI